MQLEKVIEKNKQMDMSLFIPYAHDNTTEAKVRQVLESREEMGVIRSVKLLNETSKTTGKKFKMIYIFFEKWNETDKVRQFQKTVLSDGGAKVKYNAGIGYWTILPNRSRVQPGCDLQQQPQVKYNYNDSYDSIFNSDLREMFGCQGIILV